MNYYRVVLDESDTGTPTNGEAEFTSFGVRAADKETAERFIAEVFPDALIAYTVPFRNFREEPC